MTDKDFGSNRQGDLPTELVEAAVVAALQHLLMAVTYAAPARTFAGVLAYEARIPVEFVERADAALGLFRTRPQPVASVSVDTDERSEEVNQNTQVIP